MFVNSGSGLEGYIPNDPITPVPDQTDPSQLTHAPLSHSILKAQKNTWWGRLSPEQKALLVSVAAIVIAIVLMWKYGKRALPQVTSLAEFAPWTPVVS